MSLFEISLIVSRVVNVAFNLYLLGIGIRALRAERGSFRHGAGVTLVMVGAGLLLLQVDNIVPDPYATSVDIVRWLGVALSVVGCIRLVRFVRTPDRRWEEIQSVFALKW